MTTPSRIGLFLADDNLIVREGVRALLELEDDFEVLGTADDYASLVAGAEADGTAGRRDRHPHAADVRDARASTRPRRCASAIPAPAS